MDIITKAFDHWKSQGDLLDPTYQQTHLSQLTEHGWPTKKNEAWRHTQLPELAMAPQTILDKQGDSKRTQRSGVLPDAVLQNANVIWVGEHQIDADIKDKGVLSWNLKDALQDPTFERLLTSVEPHEAHPFFDLNSAFLRKGLAIAIAEGIQCQHPIVVVYDLAQDAEQLDQYRSLVIASKDAHAKLIEVFIGQHDTSRRINSATQIHVQERAHLTHHHLQKLGNQDIHMEQTLVHVDQRATYKDMRYALGAKKARNDVQAHIHGEGAFVSLDGMYLTCDEQWIDHHMYTAHHVKGSKSAETFKGVLADKSHAVFEGRVYVAKDAQSTQASQLNQNILLSDTAQIDTAPQLEIFADDVQCAHGATVGTMDENQLFYLQSRGIETKEARQMLMKGFLQELMEEDEHPFTTWLHQQVEDKLNDTF